MRFACEFLRQRSLSGEISAMAQNETDSRRGHQGDVTPSAPPVTRGMEGHPGESSANTYVTFITALSNIHLMPLYFHFLYIQNLECPVVYDGV